MLFLGIISWKGTSRFNGAGELLFRWRKDFFFKWGEGAPWGGIGFDGGISKKIVGWGGTCPPCPPYYGKP